MVSSTEKLLAALSYFGIIAWVIILIVFQNQEPKSRYILFHLRQSLGLFLFAVAGFFIFYLLANMFNLWILYHIFSLIIFVYWILGIIYSLKGDKKELPFIGKFFDGQLGFIN